MSMKEIKETLIICNKNETAVKSAVYLDYSNSVKGPAGSPENIRSLAEWNETEFCLTDIVSSGTNPVGTSTYKTGLNSWIIEGW